jgi:DNA-binding MarR family transcriptional regulator
MQRVAKLQGFTPDRLREMLLPPVGDSWHYVQDSNPQQRLSNALAAEQCLSVFTRFVKLKRLSTITNLVLTTNRFLLTMRERRTTVSKLSKLQKRILEEGLISHWREPIHRAWAAREPGSFDIREILMDLYGSNKADISKSYWLRERGDQRERLAKPRAAISRAISRLTKRGFLERIKPTGRGLWRLSPEGIDAAALVCSALHKPTRTEMLPKIKKAYLERKARLEHAGQPMPVSWKDFCAGCFLQPQKIGKRPGVKVELDLTGI